MNLPANYTTLTQAERREVREEYVRRQGGDCHYCGKSLAGEPARAVQRRKVRSDLFPEGFFKYPIHLHHDHETGLTIGAVHCYCNAVLWQYHGE